MLTAIRTAGMQRGYTGGNPSVCAIATDADLNIIEIATTSDFGRPHAERNLIEKLLLHNLVGAHRNLKLFVTLEPCSHVGQAEPCANAVIESRMFDEVFVACIDVDTRVNGLGICRLREHNIKVETEILSDIAHKSLYREYFFARQNSRPFVTLKIACSLDGKTALDNGESKWISSENTRLYTNFLRSQIGGILVGAGTYKADKPQLNCRTEGLQNFSPKKFVLSHSLGNSPEKDYIAADATILNGDVSQCLKKIYECGVNHLLVEGGAMVVTSFLEKCLYDEIILVLSPTFIGGNGKNSVNDLGITSLVDTSKHTLTRTKRIENDILLFYERCDV